MRPRKRRRSGTDSALPPPRYDFDALLKADASLAQYAKRRKDGSFTFDFSSRSSTLACTSAILSQHFSLSLALPTPHLVPIIPGRVQYLTWAMSLLPRNHPADRNMMLDIGTGPSCIYPMLASRLFPSWKHIATDTCPEALRLARLNCTNNDLHNISVIDTSATNALLPRDVQKARPALTVCNPPFHAQLPSQPQLAGTEEQLVTPGGELKFLKRLALESRDAHSVSYFTSLLGIKAHVSRIVRFLREPPVSAAAVRSVALCPGGTTVRWAVAWSFGEPTSHVSPVPHLATQWRQVLHVRPSRKFANNLTPPDLCSLLSVVLDQMQWSTEDNYHENPSGLSPSSSLQESCSLRGSRDGCCLALDITPCVPNHAFQVHIKVEKKAVLTPSSFRILAEQIANRVQKFLDES